MENTPADIEYTPAMKVNIENVPVFFVAIEFACEFACDFACDFACEFACDIVFDLACEFAM